MPRGTRTKLSIGGYRRIYDRAAARAGLAGLDLHGPHDLRHTFATWLEDGGIPARVIDKLMGHHASRGQDRSGSTIGLRYRHMTPAMQARVVTVIGQYMATALASMPQVCPKTGGLDSDEEAQPTPQQA